jgi:hypothetical protein
MVRLDSNLKAAGDKTWNKVGLTILFNDIRSELKRKREEETTIWEFLFPKEKSWYSLRKRVILKVD